MGHHTFDVERAARLEDAAERYRYLSVEELLWALSPSTDDVVADIGSGTGFYTDDVAAVAGHVHAVDIQAEMHDRYRKKGVPENVTLLTAGVGHLPLSDGVLDAVVSTMTYHEFASPGALSEVARVVRTGGRVVVADWSADGAGAAGPPVDERYAADHAVASFEDARFDVEHAERRPETFLVVGRRA